MNRSRLTWVSKPATAVMMLPVGPSVIGLMHRDDIAALSPEEDRNFAVALLPALRMGRALAVSER